MPRRRRPAAEGRRSAQQTPVTKADDASVRSSGESRRLAVVARRNARAWTAIALALETYSTVGRARVWLDELGDDRVRRLARRLLDELTAGGPS